MRVVGRFVALDHREPLKRGRGPRQQRAGVRGSRRVLVYPAVQDPLGYPGPLRYATHSIRGVAYRQHVERGGDGRGEQ
jgi:hypothetical protein